MNTAGCAPQYVPVDTIIVARSSIPLMVAVMEYLFSWRELPNMRSWVALVGAQISTQSSSRTERDPELGVDPGSHQTCLQDTMELCKD